jgi:hypothetical protein
MTIQELRSNIWDDLYRARTTKSIQELAALHGCAASEVQTAVAHDWFNVLEERVAIAMVRPGVK